MAQAGDASGRRGGASPAPPDAGGAASRTRRLAALLVLAGAIVYANSVNGAFVFDDLGAILDNPTIRTLWPLSTVLSPPVDGLPVTGRPLANLSFALNHAVHGLDVRGYRLVNIVIHLGAALLLFGVVRRTLALRGAAAVPGAAVDFTAAAVALVWVVHPLQTGGVTYVSQRAESLASACILLALYASIRAVHAPRAGRWRVLAVAACWLGTGVKEIVAVVPVLVAVHHVVFVSGSWRRTWDGERGLLIALAASWLPLAWLIAGTQHRGGTWAGASGFTPWEYLRIQCEALIHYLRLVAWPSPLVFDYGRNLAIPAWREVWPQAAALAALFAWTLRGLWRRSPAGFLGVAFFGLLAPTSSVVPLADAVFEHRMYLASAAVIAAVLVPAGLRLGPRMAWAAVPVALALGGVTVARNADFASAIALWEDTVAKRPDNARALGNLGRELIRAGRTAEALPLFERVCILTPDTPLAPHNRAVALDLLGRRREAVAWYRRALELQPRNFLARTNLAAALAAEGRVPEALAEFEKVLADTPDFADAHRGYARALLSAGRMAGAITHFARAAELRPRDAEARFNLGDALARAGRLEEARDAFRATTTLQPDHAAAWSNLGNTLLLLRDTAGAIAAFEEAIRLRPDAMTHTNLGLAWLMRQRRAEAAAQFRAALALDPGYAPAHRGLAQAGGESPAP